jgi:Domain of unknown function (DUF6966)
MTELIGLLEESSAFLEVYGVKSYSAWLRNCATMLKNNDLSGIDKLLREFAGMGSFNDLVISPMNNHKIDESEVDFANTKLDEYRRKIYQLASGLRRDKWKH